MIAPLLSATTAVLLSLSASPLELPPSGPSPLPKPTPLTFEPDCSAVKTVQLPNMRVFGMAPIVGVDFLEHIETTLDAEVGAKPGGITVVFSLKGKSKEWGGTLLAREQHFPLPIAAPPGCEVSHTTAAKSSIGLRGRDRYERVYGSGLIHEASCMNETSWKEHMDRTGCRTVMFEPFDVHFRKATKPTCGTISVTPPPVDAMGMKRVTKGNESYSTGESYVEVDVRHSMAFGRVQLETRVTIEEAGGDHSRFTSDWVISTAYDPALAAPGCKVFQVTGTQGRLRDRAVDTPTVGYRPTRLDGTAPGADRRGVVKDAGCRAATGQWQQLGCMVRFNPISVELVPK